jgi:hypothetical protein
MSDKSVSEKMMADLEPLPTETTISSDRAKLRIAWFAATDAYLAAPPGKEKEALGEKADAICIKYFRDVPNGVPPFPGPTSSQKQEGIQKTAEALGAEHKGSVVVKSGYFGALQSAIDVRSKFHSMVEDWELRSSFARFASRGVSLPLGNLCTFCLCSREDGSKTTCSYGMHHEFAEVPKASGKTNKKDSKLCVKCGLHPKNPASLTNGCDHDWPYSPFDHDFDLHTNHFTSSDIALVRDGLVRPLRNPEEVIELMKDSGPMLASAKVPDRVQRASGLDKPETVATITKQNQELHWFCKICNTTTPKPVCKHRTGKRSQNNESDGCLVVCSIQPT